MLPESFFARNVSILAGNRVKDPDMILDILAEGGSGYHFFGKASEKVIIRKNE